MRVDVWSDVVCPWCFLGKRRLQAAIAQVPFADEIEVHWRAYLLDPYATDQPKPYRQAIERKYGPGAYDGMVKRLTPLGAAEGIDYRFDDIQRVSSIFALQLLAWAEETQPLDVVDAFHDRLFLAYFTEGGNIADHAALAGWAAEVGIDGAADALAADAGVARVRADIVEAQDREVMGVPAFLLGGMVTIPGAQEVDTFVQMLTRVHDRLANR